MNTVGKTVSLIFTIGFLFLISSVGEAWAIEQPRWWPPKKLLKTTVPFESPALDVLVNGQTGLTLKEQPTQRGQHPKHLGCVEATFKVEVDSVRDGLRQGLFKNTKNYPSLIRFSKGKNNHDREKDSFGMAIKVFNVEREKILSGEKTAETQDFVLGNNEIFFAPNPFLLLQFKKAGRGGEASFRDDPRLVPFMEDYQWFKRIVVGSRIHPSNILTQSYWSQTPYKFGTLPHVKYFVVGTSQLSKKDRTPFFINDLRHFMQEDLKPSGETKRDVTFDFMIQEWPKEGHSGIKEAPLEDPRFPWSTDGIKCKSCTKVATITIPKQTFLSPGKMAFCERMSFTPWHSLPEHEPLGGINKARKVVYQLGAKMRHVVNQVSQREVTWKEYQVVKGYDEVSRAGKNAPKQMDLAQGWSNKIREKFYHSPQGTRVIPYAWLLALKRMDRIGKKGVWFLDDANISLYGFLPDPSRHDGLPVGFAVSEDKKAKPRWVDFTCAACHTGQLKYKGKFIRIDGGPSMQLNRAFLTGLVGALKDTIESPQKFEDFAIEVANIMIKTKSPVMMAKMENKDRALDSKSDEIANSLNASDAEYNYFDAVWKSHLRGKVREYMNELIRLKVTEGKKNLFPTAWGHGRIDALGRGGNTLLGVLHPDNVRQANAPVSIPKIWDAWKYNWVQWNASLTQPTGRNIAQAIGIRSEIGLETSKGKQVMGKIIVAGSLDGMSSAGLSEEELVIETSINLTNIVGLEQQIRNLKPPRWPEKSLELKIQPARALEGKLLYEQHCIECHVPNKTNPKNEEHHFYVNPHEKHDYDLAPWPMKLMKVTDIGTDPTVANNFITRRVQTGRLNELLGGKLKRPEKVLEPLTTRIRKNLIENKVQEICPNDPVCGKLDSILRFLDDSFNNNKKKRKVAINKINVVKNEILKDNDLKEGCKTGLLLLDDKISSDLRKRQKVVCTILALVDQDKGKPNKIIGRFQYIARTNAGVWATAPFLHNGSVLNLYELLSPKKDRREKFCLGKTDFDPHKVGFELSQPPCLPLVESEFDTNVPGNSNLGHEFYGDPMKTEKYKKGQVGPELKPEERWALLEYLKTLDCEFLTLDCTGDGAEKILRTGTIVTNGQANWTKEKWWSSSDDQTLSGFWAPPLVGQIAREDKESVVSRKMGGTTIVKKVRQSY